MDQKSGEGGGSERGQSQGRRYVGRVEIFFSLGGQCDATKLEYGGE